MNKWSKHYFKKKSESATQKNNSFPPSRLTSETGNNSEDNEPLVQFVKC